MYYHVLDNGNIYKVSKNKEKRRCSEKDVQKAIQSGGGMMYIPSNGSTIIWPGMWSPSDIGNPDCGTPRYTVVEETTPVTKVIPSVKKALPERRPSVMVKQTPDTKKAKPSFMQFFIDEKKEAPMRDIDKPFVPGKELEKDMEEEEVKERKLIGSIREIVNNIPGFDEKLFEFRTKFATAHKQSIQQKFKNFRTEPFIHSKELERLTTKQNLNKFLFLSGLPPINKLTNFRKLGVLNQRQDTFYQSILVCINEGYLRLYPQNQIDLVKSFQQDLVELFDTSIEVQKQYGNIFVWAVQTLERQRRGSLFKTYEGLKDQITNQLQDIEIVYGFLTIVLGLNIIILRYDPDYDIDIECQIRNNDPTRPYIVLINLGFNKYEPVFWEHEGLLHRYLLAKDKGLHTLNNLFIEQCSNIAKSGTRVMTLRDNVSFRVWTQ